MLITHDERYTDQDKSPLMGNFAMKNQDDINMADQLINPGEWTEKELLKHLYREVIDMKRELDAINRQQTDILIKFQESMQERDARIRSLEDENLKLSQSVKLIKWVGSVLVAGASLYIAWRSM